MSSTSKPPSLLTSLDTLLTRLNILLSTPSGTDSFLRALTYTLQFLHSTLTLGLDAHLASLSARIARKASLTLPPGSSLALLLLPPYPPPRLARLAPRLQSLAGVVSEFRMFARLWGLLGMYAWGRSLVRGAGPRDAVLGAVAWAQVGVYTAYQVLENRAYLASRGVLAREKNGILRDFVWSSRFWMMGVGLDFVRLWRVRRQWREEGGVVTKQKEEEWKREMLVNVCNAPLTLHWSMERGVLGDGAVAALGMVAGWTGLRQRWRLIKMQEKEKGK